MQEKFNKTSQTVMTVNEDGDKFWRNLAGQCHRTDGPAVEYVDGTKEWWLHGKRNRTDGPAIEHADGGKEWWLNNQRITPDEFAARQGLTATVAVHRPLSFKNRPAQQL